MHGDERSVPINARTIIWRALENDASSVLIAHNHPSGNPQPSDDDLHATKLLVTITEPLNIKLVDHLIYGAGNWFSFRAAGLL